MATYKKLSFLLLILFTFILFKSPLLANNNEEDCFPFKEEWGLSTEEFKKTYKYADVVERDEIVDYGGELNLYGENIIVGYTFKDNALFQITYASLQGPETGLTLFKKFEKSLKCFFGEPKESVSVKKDDTNGYFILWEKNKTTVYLSFVEKLPVPGIEFYDNSNPINKKRIETYKSYIKKGKEFNKKKKK